MCAPAMGPGTFFAVAARGGGLCMVMLPAGAGSPPAAGRRTPRNGRWTGFGGRLDANPSHRRSAGYYRGRWLPGGPTLRGTSKVHIYGPRAPQLHALGGTSCVYRPGRRACRGTFGTNSVLWSFFSFGGSPMQGLLSFVSVSWSRWSRRRLTALVRAGAGGPSPWRRVATGEKDWWVENPEAVFFLF